jgi:putative polyhydroxyalkanoate system protein
MPTFTVVREHGQEAEQVRSAVEALAAELRREYGGDYAWQGDALRFAGRGVAGAIRVEPERVTVEVELALLLRPLRGRIEDEVRQRLDRALA